MYPLKKRGKNVYISRKHKVARNLAGTIRPASEYHLSTSLSIFHTYMTPHGSQLNTAKFENFLKTHFSCLRQKYQEN